MWEFLNTVVTLGTARDVRGLIACLSIMGDS